MYKALYRDFRPETFDELIGQDHIVRILKNQIASGSTSHAYLFCGTRGTGKTTTARILAKALNCRSEGERPCCRCDICRSIREGSFVDVVEIDAASNNGVENIRDLRDSVNYAPVMGRHKVFIIDEVHMLSTGAFNALLKTLEEPPSYVVFIMATTEPQKVPATILSRCVRLDFRRVSEQLIVDNMKKICEVRGIEAEDEALALIAVNADGSVRDSLSILEQCIFPGEVLRREDVAQILGTAGEDALIALTESVRRGDAAGALLQLDRMIASGVDVRLLMKEWLEHFRNLLLVKYVRDPERMLSMSMENIRRISDQAADVSTDFLDRAVRELSETISGTRWSPRPRVMLEMSAVKLCASQETEEAFRLRYDGMAAGRMKQAAGPVTAGEPPVIPPAPAQSAEPPAQEPDYYNEAPVPEPVYYDETLRTAAEIPPSPEPIAPPARKSPDDRVWQEILDRAASERGAFTVFINRTHLTGTKEDTFFIRCDNRMVEKSLLERGKEVLEGMVSERMGRPMKMSVDTGAAAADRKKEEKQQDLSGQVEELEKFFGRSIEVE